ncbi:hypothetical protein [Burkholderia multivorans]|uniref:hypothetical protein n=1 Tax=Burkholderia multivorans TaxID=87883 RepID=UPI0012D95ADF|nr:hypothetical protein [Burkholderia multivorans]MBU9151887.1 hypothetical protein [Burkholderia multivorans]MBU9250965.1 hypothetical protein [Burkholderia multivorans]MBU9255341.1 hypothetical protein [Burkholderia multivorans]MBU9484654.1 hypothetical protein [Burkholderia multivorans]MBY4672873.1 hypothetical protein [Burkholderia multivorans]
MSRAFIVRVFRGETRSIRRASNERRAARLFRIRECSRAMKSDNPPAALDIRPESLSTRRRRALADRRRMVGVSDASTSKPKIPKLKIPLPGRLRIANRDDARLVTTLPTRRAQVNAEVNAEAMRYTTWHCA